MPEYTAPGVYIEEIERGPRPIEGVPTSTAAFLGETERGPSRPLLVTSYAEYERYFGGDCGPGKHLPYAIAGFFENGGRRACICRIAGAGAARATQAFGGLGLEALGTGQWGNRLLVRVSESMAGSGPDQAPAGFRLQVAYWKTLPSGAPPDPFADPPSGPPPTAMEEFEDLAWDDPESGNFYARRLQAQSTLIRATPDSVLAEAPAAGSAPLTGGSDGAEPGVADYRGGDGESHGPSGLAALDLEAFRDVALVAAPAASEEVAAAVCDHCERNRFRFAVIDPPPGQGEVAALDPRSRLETDYAAFYYPWVSVPDRYHGGTKWVPPSGHVLGLYARTDEERGVWKAPANEVLRGVVGLEFALTNAAQEALNPRGVNAIREFPGRGIRVWGARTLSGNTLWKYVSVRRLFMFIEQSIYEGTQWVVLEPNDERLWERVRDSIRLFLRSQWRSGALTGRTEEQAFFISCDRSTMTQDDLLAGRLICEIGLAPARPAEFVIFRIFQHTAEAQG
ncbi:MAG TPA: phage tail sheath family protein [Allosphingosinicella sp.]|jgi:hypothetical protein